MLTRRSTFLGLAAVLVTLFASRDAPAQGRISDVLPADGAIVDRCPDRVLVRFSRDVDSGSTRITIVGPSDSSSLAIEGRGGEPMRELSIPVPDQGPGAYSVRWQITTVQGERIRGKMRFLVQR